MKDIKLHGLLPNVFIGKDSEHTMSDVWRKDVTLEKGKLYLVEASSGTGKSSLCSYIYGYRNDYQGELFFDDRNAAGLSINEWSETRKRHISILWQELRLFPELTALENVEIKNRLTKFQSRNRINTWFEQLGIADRTNYRIDRMSFGQQQRVAMIRALCQPFDFLLADEPISHLDDENSRIMGEIMTDEAMRQGAGVIVTSIGKHMELSYDKTMRL